MNNVTRIIVVRHGNTFNSGDVILRVGSATDLPLTEKGIQQGVAVGQALAQAGFDCAAIFAAPLQRTTRMAEEIGRFFPGTAVTVEKFLTELDYGIDDGQPEDDIVLRLGIVEKAAGITPATTLDELREAGKAALKRWDSEAVMPKGWRHLQDVPRMLEEAWSQFGIMVAEKFSGKTVIAVTSNGIARFSRVLLPGGGSELEGNLKLSTGAYGVYESVDGKWCCRQWNVRP